MNTEARVSTAAGRQLGGSTEVKPGEGRGQGMRRGWALSGSSILGEIRRVGVVNYG